MFNYGNGYSLSDIAAASGNRNGDGLAKVMVLGGL